MPRKAKCSGPLLLYLVNLGRAAEHRGQEVAVINGQALLKFVATLSEYQQIFVCNSTAYLSFFPNLSDFFVRHSEEPSTTV